MDLQKMQKIKRESSDLPMSLFHAGVSFFPTSDLLQSDAIARAEYRTRFFHSDAEAF